MTWSVRSSTDTGRWLESISGVEFTADPATSDALGDLSEVEFHLWPGGPVHRGVKTTLGLVIAACDVIPDPQLLGNHPELPTWPTYGGLLVY